MGRDEGGGGGGGGGWAFNQIFKKGSLTGPQLLEGVAGKDGVPFFGGGGGGGGF